jgi:hypothetical protein
MMKVACEITIPIDPDSGGLVPADPLKFNPVPSGIKA